MIDEPLRSQLGDIRRQLYETLARMDNRTMKEDEYNSLLNLESDFARKIKTVESAGGLFPYKYQEN